MNDSNRCALTAFYAPQGKVGSPHPTETLRVAEGRSREFWRVAVRRERFGELPTTDIAAALTVVMRRDEERRALEVRDKRILSFRYAVLRNADLSGAHLQGANLTGANIEVVKFQGALIEGTYVSHRQADYMAKFGAIGSPDLPFR